MERVNRILQHPVFQRTLEELEELERERIFCCHGLEHLLSVARLACIYNIEESAGLSTELLYAAALLHDIGRGEQYRTGTPHETAGVTLAEPILKDCGFSEEERQVILNAISLHRQLSREDRSLAGLLARADKKCRPCFACKARPLCNWPVEKQNLTLER